MAPARCRHARRSPSRCATGDIADTQTGDIVDTLNRGCRRSTRERAARWRGGLDLESEMLAIVAERLGEALVAKEPEKSAANALDLGTVNSSALVTCQRCLRFHLSAMYPGSDRA